MLGHCPVLKLCFIDHPYYTAQAPKTDGQMFVSFQPLYNGVLLKCFHFDEARGIIYTSRQDNREDNKTLILRKTLIRLRLRLLL